MRIDNWSIVSMDGSPYQPPETKSKHLRGNVFGNDLFTDGSKITTSRIIEFKDGFAITHTGSRYELGYIDPDYLEEYPQALSLKK